MAAADPFPGKARMLAHMNADHRADLSLIVRHVLGLSEADAADAELLDADLANLTVRCGRDPEARRVPRLVPIAPPMTSWSQRREKLVAMTMEARAAILGDDGGGSGSSSSSRSNEASSGHGSSRVAFRPPAGFDLVVMAGVVFYFVVFAAVRAGFFDPGTPAWTALETVLVPGSARWLRWLVDAIFVPVLAIHVGEAWWMQRTRLGPRGVRPGSGTWWLWTVCCFFEGLTAFRRFDQAAVQQAEGKGQAKRKS